VRGARAKRRLGQHFLSDPDILRRIAAATEAGPGDTVLEIGAGPGGLSAALVARGARVVAIEKDPDLLPVLRKRARDVAVAEADALEVDWHAIAGNPDLSRFIVAGNIPYNITSPLIDKALSPPRPARVVFLVQKEVAERIASPPGSRDYGALSVGVQAVAAVERLMTVPAGAFSPAPRVDSALLRLTPLRAPLIADAETAAFRAIVVGLFGFRRKQMGRAVRELTGWPSHDVLRVLADAGIAADRRPEALTPESFATLARRIVDAGWSGR
jgi:16S rRNA (adenine1518-N6/adenine1519-N6)-dimethyltransferase